MWLNRWPTCCMTCIQSGEDVWSCGGRSDDKTCFLSSFRPHAHSQMVFYIEACESGSMMNHLPADIDGELNFSLSVTFRWNQEIMKLQSQWRINMKHQSLDSFWTWLHLVTIRPHPHLMRNLKVTTRKPISKNGQQRLMWFIGPFPPLNDLNVIFGPD